MKMYVCAVAWTITLAILARPLLAQDLEAGTWKSLMFTPGGEYAWADFEVEQPGGSTQATMKWHTGEVQVYELRIDGDTLSFSWNPNFYMACRLERQANRQFKGACLDSRENVGPAVLSPPGVELTPEDLDFDKAFEVWNISREAYMQERYPQPKPKTVDYEEPEPLPMRKVLVGERQFNVVEAGSGDVTVVLEAGVGDDHAVWQQVQTSLGEETRSVAYDRAGLGLTEPGVGPRTPDKIAEELRSLLAAGGYDAPYVLVGHGAAAFTILSFTEKYPGDVAGIVLIDPAHPREDEAWREIDAESWNKFVSGKHSFLSTVSETAAREFDGYLNALETWENRPLPKAAGIPVVVLSAQLEVDTGKWIGVTTEGLRAKEALHREMAAELGAEFIRADDSSSYIHLNRPSLVIDAIERVLNAIGDDR